jgi:phosphoadenosine phosphosulfate reductase
MKSLAFRRMLIMMIKIVQSMHGLVHRARRNGMMTQTLPVEGLAAINRMLEGKPPQSILRWAVETYHPRLTMGTAFGAEGCCLIHMLAEIEPTVPIFNLETGYQFPETLALRERIKERYGIEVQLVRPDLTVAEYEARHHGPLYVRNPNQCCHDRKIVPLRRIAAGYDAWLSAIRRDQTTHRAGASVVEWDSKFGLAKVNPLLNWTKRDVWAFVVKHDVPYNPLHDQGYPSIGCWPCTRPVAPGEDDRAGRWAGTAKKECGLHILEHEGGSGI